VVADNLVLLQQHSHREQIHYQPQSADPQEDSRTAAAALWQQSRDKDSSAQLNNCSLAQ
jgi:hypothetical protein